MGIPNRDEVKGRVDKVLGAFKERVGHVIDNNKMERQGAAERDAGEVQEQVGKVKRKVGEVIEEVGKFVRK